MSVLSIQSRVASGYVGNSVAVPCLQRLGLDVAAVDTAVLSNHPAHGGFRGGPRPATDVRDLLTGVLAHCRTTGIRAVLSGYLGNPATGPVMLAAVATVRQTGADMLYCLDPVLGDNGRLYVDRALIEFFRHGALPAADLVVPNAFEAGLLLDGPAVTMETASGALARLRAAGPPRAAITGIAIGNDAIATVAGDATSAWRVTVPRIAAPDYGAGDAFTALLLGQLLLNDGVLPAALGHAVAAVHAILTATAARGGTDLALVDALDAVVRPPRRFEVEAIG